MIQKSQLPLGCRYTCKDNRPYVNMLGVKAFCIDTSTIVKQAANKHVFPKTHSIEGRYIREGDIIVYRDRLLLCTYAGLFRRQYVGLHTGKLIDLISDHNYDLLGESQ